MKENEKFYHLSGRLHHAERQYVFSSFESVGLYSGQPPILNEIARKGEISQKEIASKTGASPASVAVSLKRMEKNNLVSRKVDPKDNRFYLVSLTPEGERINGEGRKIIQDMVEAKLAGFSEEEISVLCGFFERMVNNMENKNKEVRGK